MCTNATQAKLKTLRRGYKLSTPMVNVQRIDHAIIEDLSAYALSRIN